jgi:dienelactone hydrolase
MTTVRTIVAMTFLLAAAGPAMAAAGALESRTVEYKLGDQAFEGWFVHPQASKGRVPGVLLVHNWLGVSAETKKQAERMAKLGLAVLAVDIYGKGIRPKDAAEAMGLAGKYKGDRKLFRERLLRGLAILREQKEVDPTKIVAAGYCFGGTGALELARAGADVQAVVSFHGGLDSHTPEDGKNIKARVVVLHGADDPYSKPADVTAFQDEMRTHNVDWQMTLYGGAVHSFTDVGAGHDAKTGAAYNQKADTRSFAAFTELVSELFPRR